MNENEVNVTINEDGADAFAQRMAEAAKVLNDATDKFISNLNAGINKLGLTTEQLGIKTQRFYNQLEKINPGDPYQGLRDIQSYSSGTSVQGRLTQAEAGNQIAQIAQLAEVQNARIINSWKTLLDSVVKATDNAAQLQMARSRGSGVSPVSSVSEMQIAAQRQRVALAQQIGEEGIAPRSGSIQNPNPLGIENLGTIKEEQEALEQMLAQQNAFNEAIRQQELIQSRIASQADRALTLQDDQVQAAKRYSDGLALAQRIIAETSKLQLQQGIGDEEGAQKSEQRLANLKIQQMDLMGVSQETEEYQQQLTILREITAARRQAQEITVARGQANAENTQYDSMQAALGQSLANREAAQAKMDAAQDAAINRAADQDARAYALRERAEADFLNRQFDQEQTFWARQERGEAEGLNKQMEADETFWARQERALADHLNRQFDQQVKAQQKQQDQANRQAAAPQRQKDAIIQSRTLAMDPDVQASLLALQTGLSVNYALIGSFTSAVQESISSIVEYDAKLRELQGIAGATETEFGRLRDGLLQASESTKFSVVELTEGATTLAQAGLSTNQILEVLPKIADAAVAVGTSFQTMADIVTTTSNVFNVSYDQTDQILNTFTTALNTSKLTIDQLSTAFQYSANIAADSGTTYQELTASIAAVAQAGVRSGSTIGTGLRQIFTQLEAPSDKMKELLQQLGLSLEDVNVRTQGLTGVLQNLHDAGLTTEQALSVFEKRTSSVLIGLLNQTQYVQDTTKAFYLSTAAEEAAAKSKESLASQGNILKNTLLAIINEAAKPYVAALISMAEAMTSAAQAMSGILIPVVTSLMAILGTLAIVSVTRLIAAFANFTIGAQLSGAAFATMGTEIAAGSALVAEAGFSMEGLTAATETFNAALLALNINPEIAAFTLFTAVILGLATAIGQFVPSLSSMKDQIDKTKTAVDDHTAASQNYQQVATQIDATIQRLVDQHQKLTNGNDNTRNATAQLGNETLNAATTFNRYGAAIDSTGESLNSLITKLQNARIAVVNLQAAESAAALSKLGIQATQQEQAAGLARTNITNSSANIPALLSGIGASNLTPQLMQILRAKPGDQNAALNASSLADALVNALAKAGGPQKLFYGSSIDALVKNLQAYSQNATGALAARAQMPGMTDQVAALRAQSDPRYINAVRQATGGYTPGGVNMDVSAASYENQVRDINAQYTKGQISAETRNQKLVEVINAAKDAFNALQTRRDQLTQFAGTTRTAGYSTAAQAEAQRVGEQQQSIGNVGRKYGADVDKMQAEVLKQAEAIIKAGGSLSKAIQLAASVGVKASSREDIQAAQVRASRGATQQLFDPTRNPEVVVENQAEDAANAARDAKADASAAAKAQAAAKRLANGLLSAAEKSANESIKLGTDQLATVEKGNTSGFEGLKDIKANTPIDTVTDVVGQATAIFNQAQAEISAGYKKDEQAQEAYIKAAGAFLNPEEIDGLRQKLDASIKDHSEKLQANQKQFNDEVAKALDRVPSISKPFTLLVQTIEDGIKALAAQLNAESTQLNTLTDTKSDYSTISARMVRQGQASSAVADARGTLYQAAIDRASAALLPQQIANQQAVVDVYQKNLVDRQITNGAGQTITGAQLAQQVATSGGQDAYLAQQQQVLGNIPQSNQQALIAQNDYINNLKTNLPAILTDYNNLQTAQQKLTALTTAQKQAQADANATWQQSLQTILQGYLQTNGAQNSLTQNLLNDVPPVLGQTQTAFKGFFSDIMTGTKSVGQSFKDLAAGILNSLMSVIESEAAKALLNFIVQIGASFLSSGGPAGSNLHRASGGDIPGDSLAALQGYQAASGATEGRDSINTVTEPGEYVLRKSAVDAIGKNNLDQLNFNGNTTMNGNKPGQVQASNTVINQQPFEIYVTTPDKTPPTSSDAIVIAATQDMLGRGALYKSVKAIMNGQV